MRKENKKYRKPVFKRGGGQSRNTVSLTNLKFSGIRAPPAPPLRDNYRSKLQGFKGFYSLMRTKL